MLSLYFISPPSFVGLFLQTSSICAFVFACELNEIALTAHLCIIESGHFPILLVGICRLYYLLQAVGTNQSGMLNVHIGTQLSQSPLASLWWEAVN